MRNYHVKEGLRDFFSCHPYNEVEVNEMRDIGKNIKDLRIRANMTQEELAQRLFVTRQTVSNYENGKSRPDVDMIVKLGEILDADANMVIYGIPVQLDKKRQYRHAFVMSGILLLLALLMIWLNGYTKELRYNSWISLPFALVRYLGLPGIWVLSGWWFIEVLSLFGNFKQWNKPYIRYIRLCLLCMLAVTFLILLMHIVFEGIGDFLRLTTDGFTLTYPSVPVLSEFLLLGTYRYPMAYSVYGILFRLIGFSKGEE